MIANYFFPDLTDLVFCTTQLRSSFGETGPKRGLREHIQNYGKNLKRKAGRQVRMVPGFSMLIGQ